MSSGCAEVLAQDDGQRTVTEADNQDSSPESNESVPLTDPARVIGRDPVQDRERITTIRRSIIIVDDVHERASNRFESFISQVDGFFSNAGTDDDLVSNGSWARIRLDGFRDSGDSFELEPSLKVRAVLPRTERKLKLLISTEDDDGLDTSEISSSSGQRQDGGSLALRFLRSARDTLNFNLDLGLRRRDGSVQLFGRVNARHTLDLGEQWVGNVANSYYYYSRSGFENTLSLDLRRPLWEREDLFFRTFTTLEWEDGQKGAIISNTSGAYWKVDDSRSIAFEGLASYHTSLNEGIDDRFRGHELRVRWRHNIWRTWFFYEVWPSIQYPATRNYQRTEGLLIRAEVVIGPGR